MARVCGGLAALTALALVACGQANRDGHDDTVRASEGGFGGSSVSGTASGGFGAEPGSSSGGTSPVASSGGGSSAATSGGTGPLSPACEQWKTASFLESCRLIFGSCPADLTSYLANRAAATSEGLWQTTATQGCGLILIGGGGGFGGSYFVFNADGELVGYSASQDTPHGFCNIFDYGAGVQFDAFSCDDAKSCRLARDATPEALCACPCPESPTSETFVAPHDCIFIDESTPCEETLAEQLIAASGSAGARLSRGCGETSLIEEGTGTRCDYDAAGNWLGASIEAKGVCPGVNRLQTGTFVANCEQATTCWLGLRDSADGLERCVGLMPPVQ